jgi:hypothetical protein
MPLARFVRSDSRSNLRRRSAKSSAINSRRHACANRERSTFGVSGSGVKVGVLSDGVSSLASLQGSGDLPLVTVLPGQAGNGDEGSAMLEIVHDLAPGAQLYFATGLGGVATFANNIKALRNAGCDIIIDAMSYFAETPFHQGQMPNVVSPTNGALILQAVNDVTASGALFVGGQFGQQERRAVRAA